jgi:hydrogenase-4 component E
MNVILFNELLKICLVLLVILTTIIISRKNLISLISIYAFHSLVLSLVAILFFLSDGAYTFLYAAILTLISKSIFIPLLLKRAQKNMIIYTDIEYHYLKPVSSIFFGLLIIISSFFIFSKIKDYLGLTPLYYFGVILGFSLVMIGFMIIFSRRKIITKILGYLVMENGVVLLSLFIGEMPLLIEMMVLMDLLVLVAITCILGFGMNSSMEEFHAKLNPFNKWFKRRAGK